jgi:hypothetical protein
VLVSLGIESTPIPTTAPKTPKPTKAVAPAGSDLDACAKGGLYFKAAYSQTYAGCKGLPCSVLRPVVPQYSADVRCLLPATPTQMLPEKGYNESCTYDAAAATLCCTGAAGAAPVCKPVPTTPDVVALQYLISTTTADVSGKGKTTFKNYGNVQFSLFSDAPFV